METREEKNKVIQKEIRKEKSIKRSKSTLKIILLLSFMIITIFLDLRFFGTSFIKTQEYVIEGNMPQAFNGVKIIHFSDLLYGSTINSNDLNYLTEEFKRIKPDIVIFTGDITMKDYDLSKKEVNDIKKFFKSIPYTIGKYSVKGDYDTPTYDLIMNEGYFMVLDNEYELVYYHDSTPIVLIGLDSNNVDLSKIENDKINSLYKITLIHNYDMYNTSLISDTVLAGHNLNGELFVPYYQGLLGNNKYNKRYYKENDTNIYISNGLGSIHKIRMFNHPSINVYRLNAK